MRILHVNTRDDAGGAAKVARNLLEAYRVRGHESWMAVGVKNLRDPGIVAIDNAGAAGIWARPWWRLHDGLPLQSRRARAGASMLAAPGKLVKTELGIEDFEFPGTRRLLDLVPEMPHVVHLHNLHGGYFDLRQLQVLSQKVPVVVTLHDPWMFTGHCAYFLDCDRWRTGCGSCPHLDTPPAMRRDNTHLNWTRKKRIYSGSSLYVSAPSSWLLERAEDSILSEAMITTKLIPNGVDLSTFHPSDKAAARERLHLPQDERILLFSGFMPVASPFKDYPTIRAAAQALGARDDLPSTSFLVLGEARDTKKMGALTLRFADFESEEARVATYYQAADVYVHAARVGAENHSLSIIEALACGTPVVATDVGGIPEQIVDLGYGETWQARAVGESEATGILTPSQDPNALASAIAFLLGKDDLLQALSLNAGKDARRRFDIQTQVDTYLAWYREIIGSRTTGAKRVAPEERGT